MVLEAVQSRAPGAPQALAELCARYWRPLYAFVRRRGRSPEDAQDLVQGFFEHLIRNRGLATVDRTKGRFRSFLLASFQWAMLLLRRATEQLQQEQAVMGKAEIFRTLKGFLGGDGDGCVPVTYEEAAYPWYKRHSRHDPHPSSAPAAQTVGARGSQSHCNGPGRG
jgi:hypothetical protein